MNVRMSGREGLPLGALSHLLYGTKITGGAGYYHDANLRGVQDDGQVFPPDEFYDDIRRINGMEKCLSPLSNDLTDLRTQVDLCCVWRYDFPENLNEVLNAIGRGKASFTRMHGQIDSCRKHEILSFGNASRGWLDGSDAKDLSNEWDERIVSWVYDALGERSELKELLAEKAFLTLGARWLDCSFWGVMAKDKESEVKPDHSESVPENWGERVQSLCKRTLQILPDVKEWRSLDGGPNPPCHFKFIHRLRMGILSISRGRWLGGKIPTSEGFEDRKAKVAEIAEMLGCWLRRMPLDKAIRKFSGPSRNLKNMYVLLGERNPDKDWLVESLRCNIRRQARYDQFSMQRWVEFGEIKEGLLKQYLDERNDPAAISRFCHQKRRASQETSMNPT